MTILSLLLDVRPLYTQDHYDHDKPSSFSTLTAYLGYHALGATILFTLFVFLFEIYLDFRQKRSYQKTGACVCGEVAMWIIWRQCCKMPVLVPILLCLLYCMNYRISVRTEEGNIQNWYGARSISNETGATRGCKKRRGRVVKQERDTARPSITASTRRKIFEITILRIWQDYFWYFLFRIWYHRNYCVPSTRFLTLHVG